MRQESESKNAWLICRRTATRNACWSARMAKWCKAQATIMPWDGTFSSVTIWYNAMHTAKVPQVHLNSDFQGFWLCQESGFRGVVSQCFRIAWELFWLTAGWIFEVCGPCLESSSRELVSLCFKLLLGQNRSGGVLSCLEVGFSKLWFPARIVVLEL